MGMRRAAAYLALCRFGTPAVLFVFGYNLCSYLGCVKKYGRLADRILKMKEKNFVTAYFHGNKYRCGSRFYLLLGIFHCQWLFLGKLEYWRVLDQTKLEMMMLTLVHPVLLVRLSLLWRVHSHEGVVVCLHIVNHGG